VEYKTERRTIRSWEMGEFTAVHKIMGCRRHGTMFRSERLKSIVNPHCIYANDIMIEASMGRFIHGLSCSEISEQGGMRGISGSHARNVTNMALRILSRIHEESWKKLKGAMHNYVLQIDGTTDSKFDMIVVVRDSISNFTLHAEKYASESYENIKDILMKVKERFGSPSGSISDMRSGILTALAEVFHGMPIRICLMHFLRDLGKGLMVDMHNNLGLKINRKGIKSALKSILRSMPDYDQNTLEEIENGFCSDRGKMEIMAIRRIIEPVLSVNGSSGYGFPFSLNHLNFFTSLKEAGKLLSELSEKAAGEESMELISSARKYIGRIVTDQSIVETAKKLSEVNMLFQKLRFAFRIPEKGNLSDDIPDDASIHDQCNTVIGEMEVYLHENIAPHIIRAAKHIIERYHEREIMLFANNADGTMPRTNNGMERFFRKIRRNVRKRNGNTATGHVLAQSGVQLALFQNLDNPIYVKTVFGSDGISAVFAKRREHFRKPGMTVSTVNKLVADGTRMILEDNLSDTPYNDQMMNAAQASRNIQAA
jgi:hypothetical protein